MTNGYFKVFTHVDHDSSRAVIMAHEVFFFDSDSHESVERAWGRALEFRDSLKKPRPPISYYGKLPISVVFVSDYKDTNGQVIRHKPFRVGFLESRISYVEAALTPTQSTTHQPIPQSTHRPAPQPTQETASC